MFLAPPDPSIWSNGSVWYVITFGIVGLIVLYLLIAKRDSFTLDIDNQTKPDDKSATAPTAEGDRKQRFVDTEFGPVLVKDNRKPEVPMTKDQGTAIVVLLIIVVILLLFMSFRFTMSFTVKPEIQPYAPSSLP